MLNPMEEGWFGHAGLFTMNLPYSSLCTQTDNSSGVICVAICSLRAPLWLVNITEVKGAVWGWHGQFDWSAADRRRGHPANWLLASPNNLLVGWRAPRIVSQCGSKLDKRRRRWTTLTHRWFNYVSDVDPTLNGHFFYLARQVSKEQESQTVSLPPDQPTPGVRRRWPGVGGWHQVVWGACRYSLSGYWDRWRLVRPDPIWQLTGRVSRCQAGFVRCGDRGQSHVHLMSPLISSHLILLNHTCHRDTVSDFNRMETIKQSFRFKMNIYTYTCHRDTVSYMILIGRTQLNNRSDLK